MKMCEQILKNRQRPNTIQIHRKKNQEHRNIASLSLQLRSCKNIGLTHLRVLSRINPPPVPRYPT